MDVNFLSFFCGKYPLAIKPNWIRCYLLARSLGQYMLTVTSGIAFQNKFVLVSRSLA